MNINWTKVLIAFCIVLITWIVADALYDWRDQRYIAAMTAYEQEKARSRNLAQTVQYFGAQIPVMEEGRNNLLDRVNQVLTLNGHSDLAIQYTPKVEEEK